MNAHFGSLESLWGHLVPDTDRPTELPDGVAEMHLAEFTSGSTESGVWSCSVGAWDEPASEVDEVMVILEGRVRITNADGSTGEAATGDLLHLPVGWAGRWDVLEPLRKFYVITQPPAPA
jgi:uncharacterized cupin superfamily protein